MILPAWPACRAWGLIIHREQLFKMAVCRYLNLSLKNISISYLYFSLSLATCIAFFTLSYPYIPLIVLSYDYSPLPIIPMGLGCPASTFILSMELSPTISKPTTTSEVRKRVSSLKQAFMDCSGQRRETISSFNLSIRSLLIQKPLLTIMSMILPILV